MNYPDLTSLEKVLDSDPQRCSRHRKMFLIYTTAFLYAPYSFLLISNKGSGWGGGGWGEQCGYVT
jgi:hypothetical protein